MIVNIMSLGEAVWGMKIKIRIRYILLIYSVYIHSGISIYIFSLIYYKSRILITYKIK